METATNDERFMSRALTLAGRGLGTVSPNPLVGCVLVRDDTIIGEGYHQKYGGPHAEVHAVNSVKDTSLLRGATAYVTLEPCSHHGKTPPCADLLIASGITRVVIAHEDTHPLVSGGGIRKLQEAGIQVDVGILRDEYAFFNRRFLLPLVTKRPYVILKWAQTTDGFIARKNFDSKWISNAQARQLVHKWRAEEDAILVGTNTARYDNPALTVRQWTGQHPTRVVIDRKLALPSDLQLFDKSVATIVLNGRKDAKDGNIHWLKIEEDSFEKGALRRLYEQSIRSIIIEGGSQTLQAFIGQGLWDEARVFQSTQEFDEGIAAPRLQGNLQEQTDVVGDTLSIYFKE